MRTKKKSFDCVHMKQRGAEFVYARLDGMTPQQEVAYWREATEELLALRAQAAKREANPVSP